MEYTREIYWNVGHGAITLIPMYLLSLTAIGVLVYAFLQRSKIYKQGQTLNRTDQLPLRITTMIKNVLLQSKVLNVRGPGAAHALFFWGFFILFLGTCLIFLQADFTDLFFGIKFLKGSFYLFFSLILDIAGLIAIIMLIGLLIRRYIVRPAGLENKKDDFIMHGLLLLILISGFLIEGARIAVTEIGTPLAAWSPVGLWVAKALYGMGEPAVRVLHSNLWWLHLFMVVIFIAIIPFTKLRHIFTTSANYLLTDLGPKGRVPTLDMEDEEAESFGAAQITDMSWKDIFDADACTSCKRCQDRCPAWATDKPLSPMKLVQQLGDVASQNPTANLAETITKDVLWACTTCRACQEICPADIEHVNKIIDMRRNLVLMEGEFPGEEVTTAMENTEVNGNPFGLAFASRGDWAAGLPVVTLEENRDVDVLYFVGCYASFDKRNQTIAKAFIQLCDAAGVKVGILGKEEKCCGEPMRKMGNEYLYQMQASDNIEQFKNYGVTQIVTTCPHCFNTLNKDYRDLGLDLNVTHYTEFLANLLQQGQLKIQSQPFDCTYHDSCYLGRYNDIYQAPRTLLQAAGATLTEMAKSGAESFCCSAGGGRILADENIGTRISEKRAQMAADTGAPTLISNCPFCLTMFEDGIKGAELDGQLQSKDLAEILVERLA
ncbi:Fe-S oxidoreductase [Desulfuromusa kysingii]|uniref:Fe-S oxidoreductase n=1 Tax=Desulfuromusa kysingii TaxID=37625 RepID=A0A1H3VIW8_9BACT|nr:heterodisulfide reductase-related iron-sulfur binding cluster [Desulfuromusa kysingii]SDZ74621.1 Fe-S oxidoreductase [Desulfuromusa kysingii]